MLNRFQSRFPGTSRTDGRTDRRRELLYQYRASVCCWRAIKTYSTEGTENDASARPPILTSESRDLELWPPDRQIDPFILLPRGLLAPIFSKQRDHNISKKRTDGWKDGRTARYKTLSLRPVYSGGGIMCIVPGPPRGRGSRGKCPRTRDPKGARRAGPSKNFSWCEKRWKRAGRNEEVKNCSSDTTSLCNNQRSNVRSAFVYKTTDVNIMRQYWWCWDELMTTSCQHCPKIWRYEIRSRRQESIRYW